MILLKPAEKNGLKGNLESIVKEKIEDFSYETISRGTNAIILLIELMYKNQKQRRSPTKGIVKWFCDWPRLEDKWSAVFNNLDVLYACEIRSLENIKKILEGCFIPKVYGCSLNNRFIFMEYIDKKTKKSELLEAAQATAFRGGEYLPPQIQKIFVDAIDIISIFNGLCNAYAYKFEKISVYAEDSIYKNKRWAVVMQERLARLCKRNNAKQGRLSLRENLEELQEQSRILHEPESYYHGDFNLLQLLGDKIIDFEQFGKYGPARDFATLCIVAGFTDASAVLVSKNFTSFFDRYLIGYHYIQNIAKQSTTISDAVQETKIYLQHLQATPALILHQRAQQVVAGEEQYANLMASIYLHAINELIRVGASYTRMEDYHFEQEESVGYNEVLKGIYKGLDNLSHHLFSAQQSWIFDTCSNRNEKKEFFQNYYLLLRDIQLVESR